MFDRSLLINNPFYKNCCVIQKLTCRKILSIVAGFRFIMSCNNEVRLRSSFKRMSILNNYLRSIFSYRLSTLQTLIFSCTTGSVSSEMGSQVDSSVAQPFHFTRQCWHLKGSDFNSQDPLKLITKVITNFAENKLIVTQMKFAQL